MSGRGLESPGERWWTMHRLVLLAGMACATHAASAQDVLPHCDPDVEGQWTGYWELGPMINNQPVGQPAEWTEITHAAVLPPPNDHYILLWCERDVVCAGRARSDPVAR